MQTSYTHHGSCPLQFDHVQNVVSWLGHVLWEVGGEFIVQLCVCVGGGGGEGMFRLWVGKLCPLVFPFSST